MREKVNEFGQRLKIRQGVPKPIGRLDFYMPIFSKIFYACGIAVLVVGIGTLEIFLVIAGLLLIIAGSLKEA